MLKLRYFVSLLLLMTAQPAFADEHFAVTPSVISSSTNELVCESPLNMGQSILGQVLMGNSYSTPPRRFFRFNVAEVSGVSRVQASGWMELQMAFRQIQRTDFSGASFQNGMMNFMGSAGGKYPVGTTFPNHVMMGIQIADVPQGKHIGIRITEVVPESSAAKAGVQVDDVVARIARKQFKNGDQYLDATAKAADAPMYDVELVRSGKFMTLKLERAFRPAITEVVIATVAVPTAQVATATPSIADELEKLLKLKEKGVLNDAEFDAQKKKLLGL